MIESARWWSWRRQRLDRSCRGIDDALHSVIALSSAHPSAPLSLLARVPRMLGGMYEGATRSRTMIRLPAMRKAIWLLAHDTAHIPFNACRGSGVLEKSLLRRVGVGLALAAGERLLASGQCKCDRTPSRCNGCDESLRLRRAAAEEASASQPHASRASGSSRSASFAMARDWASTVRSRSATATE